ncbi:hypothetical protein E4T56_gene12228 [Termitomyces sp. T112]|nr:hypothetical protein E4T56_gene12228 [Termitomyces sp. T112]
MSGVAAIPSAEEVWNQDIILGFFESGSRFSNRSPAPAYQKHVDEAYIARLGKSNPTKPNNKGRAYPDLSINAYEKFAFHSRLVDIGGGAMDRDSFLSIDNGSVTVNSAISGSVPIVASIITLVNDARLAAGKKPVGFVNPTARTPFFPLSKVTGAFNDITNGISQGCRGHSNDKVAGWDPARR